ncbi:MAG: cyclodeaminase/cyclohydrolase family protein [Acidobacteria bacterium]|nr:cyclodeaminase/cyclohydrolase family protein [Acidobacteriota bacterium]
MNLTDFEQTPVHRVFEAVCTEAARYGVSIAGSEIVGLIPKRALEMTAEWFLRVENYNAGLVLENRLAEVTGMGGLNEFLDELAAPTATPGGGSAAAAAAAMAASLGAMVSRLAKLPAEAFDADRKFFSEAVKRDAEAYSAVVAAHKLPKDAGREAAVEQALHEAAKVPLEVAEESAGMKERLRTLAGTAPARFHSDVDTALALADAALGGAVANVRINLESMKDAGLVAGMRRRLDTLA